MYVIMLTSARYIPSTYWGNAMHVTAFLQEEILDGCNVCNAWCVLFCPVVYIEISVVAQHQS